ncbi:MAG: STAS domain-containing protein [Phycisphaerales bacterium]|nr:STAS domain-containing protein [Phycisphaerales bacterium]
MEVNIEHQAGTTIVLPIGDVDLSNSRDLQTHLREEMSRKPGLVVVDLAKVSYMDSSGVATLVEAMQIARRQATKLVLCELNDKVRAIFEIARLDRVFTIVGTRADAGA